MADNSMARPDGPGSQATPSAAGASSPVGADPSRDLGHDLAIKALCDCAGSVTILSYREAIEGYFTLRELRIP